jgi:polyhydroxyalkanoate synthesis regulator phasin
VLLIRKKLAAAAVTVALGLGVAACGSGTETLTTTAASETTATQAAPGGGGGPGGRGQSVSSVSSEEELVSLIQAAYGEPSLGLHRGHQDVESTLIDVLGITHDEMHVRMDAGQNLAAIAEDLGVDQQELIDALVATRSSAIDALVDAGTITQQEADAYTEQLTEAYTFRITWDGQAETPTAESV